MNWADERYVRLYTRDTVTFMRWPWETRAVFVMMLRKVDRSGVLDTGRGNKAEAVALILGVPIAVATVALASLLEDGTLTESERCLCIPNFVEAQEAKQSDRARQSESRARRRESSIRNQDTDCHTVSQPVTSSHTVSQPVTPAVPSRAVPSRAVPSKPARKPRAVVDEAEPVGWQQLVARVVSMAPGYAFTPRDAKALKACLALAKDDAQEVLWRWGVAWRHQGFPAVRALHELERTWNHWSPQAKAADTRAPVAAESVDWTSVVPGEVAL